MLTVRGVAYTVVTTIYANDLLTDMNPGRGNDQVSIGLIARANGAGDAIIAIRGTEGIDGWIHDAEFLQVPCPFLPGSGYTRMASPPCTIRFARLLLLDRRVSPVRLQPFRSSKPSAR